jgi:hypothetical protein
MALLCTGICLHAHGNIGEKNTGKKHSSMVNQIVKEVVIYLMILSFFITGEGFLVNDVTIYWYYPLYLAVLIFGVIIHHKMNLQIAIFLIALWCLALMTTFYQIEPVIKQLVNISFSLVALYYLFVIGNFDLQFLIKKYIVISKVVVVFGFIQVTLFSLDQGALFLRIFQFLRESNITFRFQSVCQEPSYAAYVLAPLVFMSLHVMIFGTSRFLSRRWAIVFVMAYLLTFSLVAYVGIVLMVLMLYFKNFTYRRLYLFVVVLAGIVFFAIISYRNIPLLKFRVDDTYFAYSEDITKYEVYTKVNLSTYAILSNLYVATSSMKDHPITGTGLGTYSIAYDHYLPEEMKSFSTINNGEGSSMAFRLSTETGILGLGLFMLFLFRFKIKGQSQVSEEMDLLWVLNSGILIMTVLLLIRHGHYTTQGRIFFFLLYYFSFREYAAGARQRSSTHLQATA